MFRIPDGIVLGRHSVPTGLKRKKLERHSIVSEVNPRIIRRILRLPSM